MAHDVKTGTVTVDGTNLYWEIRGSGPTLLFIPGAEGDAEEYLRVAELLTGRFTTLCYDRRGYSRSPRPADLAETLPFFGEVAHWLGARTGSQVDLLPGNHALHYALPDVAAQAITDFAAAD
jgi:pimeloyl-ACP methyl ester carboxylesterase